jgi:oligopeptide transport system substrate-binding protein
MASGKTWNRRAALTGGAALAAGGGYLALGRRAGPAVHHKIEPGTFRRGNVAEPESLDPCLVQGQPEEEIIGDLMIGLTTSDVHARPIPGMATHWETSADGLTWIFHLREALWSDGTPVSADDFVFSWQRILDPASAAIYAYFLYPLKNAQPISSGKMPVTALGARAVDARTLEVRLEHPAPYLLEMLTHMTMVPQPRHVVRAKGRAWAQPGAYVSNGPYLLSEWVPNGHVTLLKNPRFYDAANVSVRKVIFYPTDDYGAALRRFRAGELDFQDRMPDDQIGWIRQNIPQTIDLKPQLIVDFLSVNMTRKPFDDIRVRQAIDLALNREAIAQKILRGGYGPAYSFVPPTVANYPGGVFTSSKGVPPMDAIARAQALMAAAGFSQAHPLRCTYMIRSTTAGNYRSVAAAVQQMLALVHIDIAILPNDMMMFYDTIQQQNYDIAQAGWAADFNDASTFLDLLRIGSGNNWGKYLNPAYDAALDAAQHDTDIASRGRTLATAEAMVLRDHAVMPLYFWLNRNITWPYIRGWAANPLDYHRTRWVTIDEAARARQFA